MTSKTECDIHNWFWAEDDEYGCPVCEGAAAERERIIALLESIRQGDEWIGREYAIALIKGETE
jgi:hypothetical protein